MNHSRPSSVEAMSGRFILLLDEKIRSEGSVRRGRQATGKRIGAARSGLGVGKERIGRCAKGLLGPATGWVGGRKETRSAAGVWS